VTTPPALRPPARPPRTRRAHRQRYRSAPPYRPAPTIALQATVVSTAWYLVDLLRPVAIRAARATDVLRRRARRPAVRGEFGQSTVEYALLLLGAAAIALVVVAWVTRTDLIGRLFDTVVGRILEQA